MYDIFYITMARGKLEEFKKQKADLIESAQSFCISPNRELFEAIDSNNSVKNSLDEYATWRSAVEYMYFEEWGLEIPETNDFENLQEKICEAADRKPNASHIQQLWNLYYATGEDKYLDLAFQVMGNPNITEGRRRKATDLYIATMILYKKKVPILNPSNPEKFDLQAFSDRIQSKVTDYEEKVEAIDDINRMLGLA